MKKNDTLTLDTIEEFLGDCIADLKREDRELSFSSRYGKTVVYVEARNDQTEDDNTVTDRVLIRTALPQQLEFGPSSVVKGQSSSNRCTLPRCPG